MPQRYSNYSKHARREISKSDLQPYCRYCSNRHALRYTIRSDRRASSEPLLGTHREKVGRSHAGQPSKDRHGTAGVHLSERAQAATRGLWWCSYAVAPHSLTEDGMSWLSSDRPVIIKGHVCSSQTGEGFSSQVHSNSLWGGDMG